MNPSFLSPPYPSTTTRTLSHSLTHSLSISLPLSVFLSLSLSLSFPLFLFSLNIQTSRYLNFSLLTSHSLSLTPFPIPPPLSYCTFIERSARVTAQRESPKVTLGYALLTNYRIVFLPFSLSVPPLTFSYTSVRKLVRSNTSVRDKKAVDRSLEIVFSDFRSVSFIFQPKLGARRRFVEKLGQFHPKCVADTFAFAYGSAVREREGSFSYLEGPSQTQGCGEEVCDGWRLYNLLEEYRRMGISDDEQNWRISNINTDYHICRSYPPSLVVPFDISDAQVCEGMVFMI